MVIICRSPVGFAPDDGLQSLRPAVGDLPQLMFFAFPLHNGCGLRLHPFLAASRRFSFTLRIHPWDSRSLAPFYGPHQIPTLFAVNLYIQLRFCLRSPHFPIFLGFIFNDSDCPAPSSFFSSICSRRERHEWNGSGNWHHHGV
jgi:hypothetical protein